MRDHRPVRAIDRLLDRLARIRVRGVRLSSALLVAAIAVTILAASLPWIHGQTKYNGFIHWTGLDDWGDGLLLIFLSLGHLLYVRLRSAILEVEARARWLPLAVALMSAGVWWIAFDRANSLVYVGPPDGARVQLGLYVEVVAVLLALLGAAIVVREDHRPGRMPSRRPNPDAVPTERVR